MITVKILADSVNPSGDRLTSFLLTYPRFIHSELMTHRAFSRNAASSRAIPIEKMLASALADTAFPERWGSHNPGMQSGEEVNPEARRDAIRSWQSAAMKGADSVRMLNELGVHKSVSNRILEPFIHMACLVTSGAPGLMNFFKLRANPAAQPEFQVLAYAMLQAWLRSATTVVPWGGWHVPQFRPDQESQGWGQEALQIAVARCARLSYLTHDGEHAPEKDLELFNRLRESGHWSPFEHVAQADDDERTYNDDHGNFPRTWVQMRKQYANESHQDATMGELETILREAPNWVLERLPF